MKLNNSSALVYIKVFSQSEIYIGRKQAAFNYESGLSVCIIIAVFDDISDLK